MTPTNDGPVTVGETLRWYAENAAGCRKIGRDGDVFRQALDADGGKRALAALASAPAGDGVIAEVVELARRDIAREQTDFLGRMGQALCTYHGIFDDYPDGDLPEDVQEEADDQISALAGLALAQLVLLRHPSDGTDPVAALDRPRAAVGEDFLTQLRRVNTDRYQAWIDDGQDAGILFDAAELGGEVGELLNVVKKLEREERGWRGSRAAPGDFADECADVLICLDKLARRKGVDLAAATVAKFNATSAKVDLPQRLALHSPTMKMEG